MIKADLMESEKLKCKTYNYPDIFSDYFFRKETKCKQKCPDHVLILVYSGELIVRLGENEVRIKKGEYVFLCHDINIILERKSVDGQSFKSTFMGFSSSFLNEFYRNLNKKKVPQNIGSFNNSIIEISKNPFIDSLYLSMKPYFYWNAEPIKRVLEIKLTEAVYSLLAADKRFFSCLFDASQNIAKEYEFFLCPQHCITTKCLEIAYLKLQDGDRITDYMEVAYTNVRSIIRVYDDRYAGSFVYTLALAPVKIK